MKSRFSIVLGERIYMRKPFQKPIKNLNAPMSVSASFGVIQTLQYLCSAIRLRSLAE